MERKEKFRFEASNPHTTNEWVPLFEIGEEDLLASLQLRDELNRIASSVVMRIVDKKSLRVFG